MIEPYYSDAVVRLYLGDCRDVLPALADDSVDAVVCDPPYEINFMSRGWDSTGIAYDVKMWSECLRVLKPGGHLLAFGATRTYHRLVCAIEDAGFEIRDSIHWIYGGGFPKGQNIGKRIDKKRDDRSNILAVTTWLRDARESAGWTTARIDGLFGFNGMASHWTATASKAATVPTLQQWARLRDEIGFDDTDILPLVTALNARKGTVGEDWTRREITGYRSAGLHEGRDSVFLHSSAAAPIDGMIPITAPVSTGAQTWDGWNTTLKPAHEPIVLARKSTGFNTTVANVLQHGTGALNIRGCRVEANDRDVDGDPGRWPANVVFSHDSECGDRCVNGCPVAALDQQAGVRTSGANPARRGADKFRNVYGDFAGEAECIPARGMDSGPASRFFPVFRYQAKAPVSERPRLADGTAHSTVKPLTLMAWLVRLVTPPGGTVLDPFAGSGTTLEGCAIEGFHAIGIEREPEHAELCVARLSKPIQPTLDGLA